MRFLSILAGLVAFVAISADANAALQACRTIPSVISSSELDTNRDQGGHIAKHVINEGIYSSDADAQAKQTDTFFEDEDQYESVAAVFLASGAGNCETTGAVDNVVIDLKQADFVGDPAAYTGYNCKAASIATDVNPFAAGPRIYCSQAGTSFTPAQIRFVLKWTGEKWIIRTAFPMP
ncbi:hypothetical protein GCM10007094_05120 [Pseudovibrio japonicus]|uniref:Uncharacterized protein n=1 Tax=Pseudovibrio japonicus TaxID=366534 RepID=A0ABQ3E162_9HYPH|nr:hypothetical protein [Pseudovibrio japonicus]GHB20142.1 hypothetical protein GCM10007094_05120 [Pseudovibrio japonicus]